MNRHFSEESQESQAALGKGSAQSVRRVQIKPQQVALLMWMGWRRCVLVQK